MNLVPQFGFFELLLIAVIALIVVGPRDLPRLMRSAGRMVAKAKAMASEFTSAFDQMARETEMEELRQEIDALKKANPVDKAKKELEEAIAPVTNEFRKDADALSNSANVEESMKDPQPVDRDEEVAAKS